LACLNLPQKPVTLLLRNPDQENTEDKSLLREKENEIQNLQKEVRRSKEEIRVLQEEVKRSKDEVNRSKEDYIRRIKSLEEKLANSLDPVEIAEVRAHFEGLQSLVEEKDKRIDDLTREAETLNVFAHYFKNVDVKQIEAPAAEKKKPWYKFW
jgi:predicted RNase H-like nuclease (RuvC/YqgF family)